jgi:hypothetical protein
MKKHNEEQFEMHWEEICNAIHELWDKHENSSCITEEKILWSIVYTAAENAFHSGMTRHEISTSVRDAIRMAHEIYEEECGEFDRSSS